MRKQLDSSHLPLPKKSNKKKILVPLIESNHDQIMVVLIIAKALELRGHEIHIILCDSRLRACEIRNVRNDNNNICQKCTFKRENIVSLFGFKTFLLSQIINNHDKKIIDKIINDFVDDRDFINFKDKNILPVINDSITRYLYGSKPNTKKQTAELKKNNLETYLTNYFAAKSLNDSYNYDIIFNNMRVYTSWQPYFDYADSNGLDAFTIHGSIYDSSKLIMNLSELLTSDTRYKKFLKFRNNEILNSNEEKELEIFLGKRFSGKSNPLFLDIATMGRPEDYKDLKFNNNKRKIFLFTNLFWDIGISDQSGTFKDNTDWCIHTIKLLADNPEIDLYIKTHPAESFDKSSKSNKGISDIIKQNFPELPSNVFIIDQKYKVNSYDLFPYIDLGVVFSGTLGLEMLLSEIKVINIGKASYNSIPGFVNPESKEIYDQILLGKKPVNSIEYEQIRLFAYFFFLKSLIDFKPTDSVYGLNLRNFRFSKIEELMPGRDKHLDHIINCIIAPDSNSPECH